MTAEEKGLLGAKYYAAHPLYPLERTLADINLDVINLWGPTKDDHQHRHGPVDARRPAGRDRRSDTAAPSPPTPIPRRATTSAPTTSNSPSRACPPSIPRGDGSTSASPPISARRKQDEYTAKDYHKASDEVKPDWDLSGAVEDVRLLVELGYRVAQADRYPEWKPDSEFRARREAMLKAAKP